jgi:hypothetical protein
MADILSGITPAPGGTRPPYQTFQPGFVPGTYYDSGPLAGTCSNFTPCLVPCTTIPSSGSNCSEYCGTSYFNVVSGQKIICANFSLADALTSLLGKGIDTLLNPFSNIGSIIKWIGYIIVGIVSFFIIFILVRFLWSLSNVGKSNSSKQIAQTG